MNTNSRLALSAGAFLTAIMCIGFVIGGDDSIAPRAPNFVQVPRYTSIVVRAPAAVAPNPMPLPPQTVAVSQVDYGIWSTPAEFAAPE